MCGVQLPSARYQLWEDTKGSVPTGASDYAGAGVSTATEKACLSPTDKGSMRKLGGTMFWAKRLVLSFATIHPLHATVCIEVNK